MPNAVTRDESEPARPDTGGGMRVMLAIEMSNPSSPGDGVVASRAGVALALVESAGAERSRVTAVAAEHWADGAHQARRDGRGGGSGGGGGEGGDDWLMPAIDRLFGAAGARERGLGVVDVDRVVVSAGPGGYTAVRVACATGKMIAEGVNARRRVAPGSAGACQCVRVWSHLPPAWLRAKELSAAATRAGGGGTAGKPAGLLAVALAGKGQTAWVSGPLPRDASAWDERVVRGACGMGGAVEGDDRGGSGASGGVVMDAATIGSLAERGVVELLADGFLPAPMRQAATAAGVQIAPPPHPAFDPVDLAEVGLWLPAVDGTELNPIYPREPDAVTLWRERKERQQS